mgnify:CR=1 FL=1|tara:strand:+ start:304339 stop:305553 length:1215 start_codon:yes stop_codon:yes gene_type:complete
MLNLALFAIPFTALLILIEYILAGSKRKLYFNFKHSMANMSHGIFERFSSIFLSLLYFFPYKYISENFGLFDIKPNIFTWIGIIVFMDFCYYWYHRFGHTVNIMWAGHVVHHQSETYNLTTGARITMIQSLYRFFFYAFVPLMGFPIEMVMASLIFHGMFSLYAHTQLINRLGFLEYIIITPSHHRVHHANNEEYLDKNYGNVFIFWDYLFGTFKKEETKPTYGLTKQMENYGFLYNNFHYYFELYYAVKKQKGLFNKLRVLFGPPTLLSGEERELALKNFKPRSENNEGPKAENTKWLVLVRLIVVMAFSSLVVGYYQEYQNSTLLFSTLITLFSLIQIGRLVENSHLILSLEIVAFLSCAAIFFTEPSPAIKIVTMSSGLVHLLSFLSPNSQRISNKLSTNS